MTSTPGAERPAAGLVAVLFAACLFVASGLSIRSPGDEASFDDAVNAIDLVEARSDLEIASLDVVAWRMLGGIADGPDVEVGLASAAGRYTRAADVIAEIASRGGEVAREALLLVDDAGAEVLDDPLDADLADVFYVGDDSARYAGRTDAVDARLDAVHQAGFIGALPTHALIEAIAADVSVHSRQVEPTSAEFFAAITTIVRDDGGWFGADPSAPLDDSVWIEIDDARQMLPRRVAQMEDLVVESPLVVHDVWMRELGGGFTGPPFELLEVVDIATALRDDLSDVIDELVAEERRLLDASTDSDGGGVPWVLVASVAVGLVALVSLVWGTRTIVLSGRSSRALAALSRRDALTGVGNRRELEERIRPMVSDGRFAHHAVAMVDLDRFKMVNDMSGHAVGDAVLVEVARRLGDVAAAASREVPGSENAVIRLGGDEFLVTLHGSRPFDRTALRELFARTNDTTIDVDGERVGLGFSVGIAEASGASELDHLMAAADLAVYDDKASRTAVTGAACDAGPSSPGSPRP